MRTEPELQDTYLQWRQNMNDPKQNALMLAKIQPWVDHAVLAAGGNVQNPAMRAKANMMAVWYLRQYDPNRSSIKNFLYAQLRGLNRVYGNDQNIIQIPERVVLGRKAISEAGKELLDELGRAPSTEEIADRTGIPVRTIQKWQTASVPLTEGGMNTLTENSNYLQGKNLGRDQSEEAWQNYVYDALPDRSRAVMERLYGMYGRKPMTPAQISRDLKITQAAVSQHRKKIDTALNDDSRYTFFGD